MQLFLRSLTCCAMAIGLTACKEDPTVEKLAPLSATSMVIDGETYVITRSTRTLDGNVTEGWSIVYDGLAVSCPEASKQSCAGALEKFKGS